MELVMHECVYGYMSDKRLITEFLVVSIFYAEKYCRCQWYLER